MAAIAQTRAVADGTNFALTSPPEGARSTVRRHYSRDVRPQRALGTKALLHDEPTSPGWVVNDPSGASSSYVSVRANTSYQTYRRDEPEVQVCDRRAGTGQAYVSPGGNGPANPRQGSSYAGQTDDCSQQNPQTGIDPRP
jgi:hypothetical protein